MNYTILGFLQSEFELDIEFLTPIFFADTTFPTLYVQNIDALHEPLEIINYSAIELPDDTNIIAIEEDLVKNIIVRTPIYALKLGDHEIICGSYLNMYKYLFANLNSLSSYKHIYYDILLFLGLYTEATTLIKDHKFYPDYYSENQINLCKSIKLEEINSLINDSKNSLRSSIAQELITQEKLFIKSHFVVNELMNPSLIFDLFSQICNGISSVQRDFLDVSRSYIISKISKYKINYVDFLDIFNSGTHGLMKALHQYKESDLFLEFVDHFIEKEIAIKSNKRNTSIYIKENYVTYKQVRISKLKNELA